MNKICTSLEQSKKLIELGIDINTANMCWTNHLFNAFLSSNRIESTPPQEYKNLLDGFAVRGYFIEPAWSLSALLDVLPFHLIVDNQIYRFSMEKGLDKNGETYAIKYAVFNTTFYFYLTDYYNNPVDACVSMIEELHKQKLL